MNRSESISEIAKALAAFQQEVKQPSKNGKNPHFKSEYVTLDDTIKAINETAPKHGLSYIQTPIAEENGVGVITTILHISGQYMEFPPLILPMDKKTAQGVGSAITYARRYSISSIFGLVSDLDDDANGASGNSFEVKSTSSQGVSGKQVGMIKALALQVGKLKGRTDKEVLALLPDYIGKFESIDQLTKTQGSKAIEIMTSWKEKSA